MMEKPRQVAVYGSSLYMAGIATSLKADSTLNILCVSPDSSTVPQNIDENDLAAIIFDLTDPAVKLDVAVLHNRPGLLLIGVDPSKDEILVLSSHPVQAHSMADLVKVIHQWKPTSSTSVSETH